MSHTLANLPTPLGLDLTGVRSAGQAKLGQMTVVEWKLPKPEGNVRGSNSDYSILRKSRILDIVFRPGFASFISHL